MLQTFLNSIFTTQNLSIIGIVAIAIALFTIGLVIFRNGGLKFINTAKSVVDFVESTLKDLGVKNEKLSTIISLISQALIYVLAIETETDNEKKTADGLNFIKNIVTQLGYTLTDNEVIIIENVLRVSFIFISSLNLKVTTLKYNKSKYDVKSVEKLAIQMRLIKY